MRARYLSNKINKSHTKRANVLDLDEQYAHALFKGTPLNFLNSREKISAPPRLRCVRARPPVLITEPAPGCSIVRIMDSSEREHRKISAKNGENFHRQGVEKKKIRTEFARGRWEGWRSSRSKIQGRSFQHPGKLVKEKPTISSQF